MISPVILFIPIQLFPLSEPVRTSRRHASAWREYVALPIDMRGASAAALCVKVEGNNCCSYHDKHDYRRGQHIKSKSTLYEISPPPPPPPLDRDSQSLARLPLALQATLDVTRYSEVYSHTLLGREPHPDQSPPNGPKFRCQSPPCLGSKKESGKSELTNKIMVGKTMYVISTHRISNTHMEIKAEAQLFAGHLFKYW
jgi:hypothetical protein